MELKEYWITEKLREQQVKGLRWSYGLKSLQCSQMVMRLDQCPIVPQPQLEGLARRIWSHWWSQRVE